MLVKYLTGKDIKDDSKAKATVLDLGSHSFCGNPTLHLINPGEGPSGIGLEDLQSPPITDDNIAKGDRQKKNQFEVLATGGIIPAEYRLRDDLGLCKQSNGTQWNPLFWKDDNCNKGFSPTDSTSPNTCYGAYHYTFPGYRALAGWINDTLTLVPSNTPVTPECKRVPDGNGGYTYTLPGCSDWAFVLFLDTFALDAYVETAGQVDPYSHSYFLCTARPNNEPNAAFPGEPYSLNNPPAEGWGYLLPEDGSGHYKCDPITPEEWQAYGGTIS